MSSCMAFFTTSHKCFLFIVIMIRNRIRHLILVPKVCIFDMLSQPVACIINPALGNRCCQSSHSSKEGIMLVDMLILLF